MTRLRLTNRGFAGLVLASAFMIGSCIYALERYVERDEIIWPILVFSSMLAGVTLAALYTPRRQLLRIARSGRFRVPLLTGIFILVFHVWLFQSGPEPSSDFFSTSAQVLAVLILTNVVEARRTFIKGNPMVPVLAVLLPAQLFALLSIDAPTRSWAAFMLGAIATGIAAVIMGALTEVTDGRGTSGGD